MEPDPPDFRFSLNFSPKRSTFLIESPKLLFELVQHTLADTHRVRACPGLRRIYLQPDLMRGFLILINNYIKLRFEILQFFIILCKIK